MNMKPIKKLAAVGLSSILALSLAACSGDNAEKSSNTNDGGKNEQKNPNIKIKVKSSETADHHDALFTSLSAGSGAPDIAMLEIDQFDRFKVAQDRFANLYDLGANDVKDQYLDWKWEVGENADG